MGEGKPNQTKLHDFQPLFAVPRGRAGWLGPTQKSFRAGRASGRRGCSGSSPILAWKVTAGATQRRPGLGRRRFCSTSLPALRATAHPGPQPLPSGRGPGGSRGRHFSPGHGLRRHESLTRRLAGLRPGADGVAEHREAQVAQALTNRVRQLHAWPGGSLTPRASPWARRRRDAVSLATGLCQPLGTRDLGSSRI